MSSEDAPSTSLGSQSCLAYPQGDPRGLSRSGREERRFPTSRPAVEGPQKGRRGGSASPRPAPLRPTHRVPSPPAPGKAAAGAAARCGAGGRCRDGARRRADEMRARRLWAVVLVVEALAGVGVGGEWGSRAVGTQVSGEPRRASCRGRVYRADVELGSRSGGSCASALRVRGARLEPSELGTFRAPLLPGRATTYGRVHRDTQLTLKPS